jgi:hypothetical protein
MTSSLASPHLKVITGGASNTAAQLGNGYERLSGIRYGTSEYQDFRREDHKMATPQDDLTDAKLEAAEARTDTKIARIEGKIDTAVATLLGELRGIRDDVHKTDQFNHNSRWILISTIVASTLALAGVGIGLASYGNAMFGRGMDIRSLVQSSVKETIEHMRSLPPAVKPDASRKQ